MAKREFLQLAHTLNTKKHGVGGWWYSEKLDGMRCYWDGGMTRGMLKSDVPWANTAKDHRYVVPPVATGLWSRYGNVVHAPSWWLDALPNVPLDGELWIGYGYRQTLMSAIKGHNPDDSEWAVVKLHCYGFPAYETIFADGKINNINFKKEFHGIMEWMVKNDKMNFPTRWPNGSHSFRNEYEFLERYISGCKVATKHQQWGLPMQTALAEKKLEYQLELIDAKGGEGLIIRNPDAIYKCMRNHDVLKLKSLDDAEGKVVGYVAGRKTDKGSKLLGMMGAMILEIDGGKRLELSGFTDEERTFLNSADTEWAENNPGQECPSTTESCMFNRGETVTFRYRGLSKDGIPQEARYWRKHG